VMVFIWARILAVDASCRAYLLKDNGYSYFIQILSPASGIPVGNASEHRAMCAFILSMFCRGFHQGQVVCMPPNVMGACLAHLGDENPLLRQWACLCLSQLWHDFAEAKWQGIREGAHLGLCELATDNVPEVRATVLYALTSFFGIPEMSEEVAKIAGSLLIMTADGSNMVRKELVIFLSMFVKRNEGKFLVAAFEQMVQERDNLTGVARTQTAEGMRPSTQPSERHYYRVSSGPGALGAEGANGSAAKDTLGAISPNTIFSAIWQALLMFSVDPFPEVGHAAQIVVDYVHLAFLQSPLSQHTQDIIKEISRANLRNFSLTLPTNSIPESKRPVSPGPTKAEGYFTTSLRRSASIAASLKHMALGYASGETPLLILRL